LHNPQKSLGYSHQGTDKPYKGARDFPATVAGEYQFILVKSVMALH